MWLLLRDPRAGGVVFVLMGIFLTYINLNEALRRYSDLRSHIEATAIVTSVSWARRSDGVRNSVVDVQYEVNGVTYMNSLRERPSSRLHPGATIKIYYNPQSPGVVYSENPLRTWRLQAPRIYPEGYVKSRIGFITLGIILTSTGIWFIYFAERS